MYNYRQKTKREIKSFNIFNTRLCLSFFFFFIFHLHWIEDQVELHLHISYICNICLYYLRLCVAIDFINVLEFSIEKK